MFKMVTDEVRDTVEGLFGSVSFVTLLAILFIGLKLTNYVDWNWVWVTAPIWGVFAYNLIRNLSYKFGLDDED